AAYSKASAELAGARQVLEQVARGIWGTTPPQVPGADPVAAGGAWARAADFARQLGLDGGSVEALVAATRGLENRWEALEGDARAWDEREKARKERAADLEGKRGALQAVL